MNDFERKIHSVIDEINSRNRSTTYDDLHSEMWEYTREIDDSMVNYINENSNFEDDEVTLREHHLENVTRDNVERNLAVEKLRREICERVDDISYSFRRE